MLTPARLWSEFDDFLRNRWSFHPLQLGLYRIIFGCYVLFGREVAELRWISDMPEGLHRPPPGLGRLLPASPPFGVLLALEIAIALAIVAMLVGYRTPVASRAVGILGLFSNTIFFSFGKIDHNILVWIVPLVMASAGWGSRLSIDSRLARSKRPPRDASVPTAIMALVVAFGFFTAALPKLAGGWLSPGRSATQRYFERQFITAGRTDLLATPFSEFDLAIFWESLDWITIFFEFAVAFLVLWPSIWRFSLTIATTFHLGVLLMMNISFESHYVVYLLFFIPFLMKDRLSFWGAYAIGCALLPLGYFPHRAVLRALG